MARKYVGPYSASTDPATKANVDAAVANKVTSTTITNIVKLTQSAYDALGTKDSATLYLIVG